VRIYFVEYAATNDEMQVRDSRGITDDKKINLMKISQRKISQKEYYAITRIL